jgi:hypothetical protein
LLSRRASETRFSKCSTAGPVASRRTPAHREDRWRGA